MVQPPQATAEAHFAFPTPPFELVGELTVPFELHTDEAPEED